MRRANFRGAFDGWWLLVVLALAFLTAFAVGCAPLTVTPQPSARVVCGREAPRYPDDDSGDPGYINDGPCPSRGGRS